MDSIDLIVIFTAALYFSGFYMSMKETTDVGKLQILLFAGILQLIVFSRALGLI